MIANMMFLNNDLNSFNKHTKIELIVLNGIHLIKVTAQPVGYELSDCCCIARINCCQQGCWRQAPKDGLDACLF